MDVSVVIPVYNRADVLGRAVESVLSQTHPVGNVVVVDDGSKDNCRDVVMGFRDPRVTYVRSEANIGASAARNKGIRATGGDWLAFLDSDDRWAPTKIERQIDIARRQPGLDAVYCAFERISSEGRRVTRSPEGTELQTLLLTRQYVITLSTLLVKRDVLMSVGLFDEALPSYQDTDLFLRLVPGARFGYVDEVLVTQDVARIDRITAKLDLRIRGYGRVLDKHAGLLRQNRRGLADYWSEYGRLKLKSGDGAGARTAFMKSLLLNPAQYKTYVRFLECSGGGPLIRRAKMLLRS